MTPQTYEDVKKAYLEDITSILSEAGGLVPRITVLADHKEQPKEGEKSKVAIIHIPIPDHYMKNDEGKEDLIENILPEVFVKIKTKFDPVCVAWASEAWMRIADADSFNPETDDFRSIPIKTEVLIIIMEDATESKTLIYEIKREGQQITANGDLVDIIKLEERDQDSNITEVGGIFSGLYKKLMND